MTTLWICYMIPPQTLKAICIRLAPHPIIPLGMWRMRYIWIFYVISLMIPFYSMVYTVYSFVKISESSAWMFWLDELGKVMIYITFLSHRLIKYNFSHPSDTERFAEIRDQLYDIFFYFNETLILGHLFILHDCRIITEENTYLL